MHLKAYFSRVHSVLKIDLESTDFADFSHLHAAGFFFYFHFFVETRCVLHTVLGVALFSRQALDCFFFTRPRISNLTKRHQGRYDLDLRKFEKR